MNTAKPMNFPAFPPEAMKAAAAATATKTAAVTVVTVVTIVTIVTIVTDDPVRSWRYATPAVSRCMSATVPQSLKITYFVNAVLRMRLSRSRRRARRTTTDCHGSGKDGVIR